MTKTDHSIFVKAQSCVDCDFVEVPPLLRIVIQHLRIPPPAMEVCPRCGGALQPVTGRFAITTTTRGLFGAASVVDYKFEPRGKKETQ